MLRGYWRFVHVWLFAVTKVDPSEKWLENLQWIYDNCPSMSFILMKNWSMNKRLWISSFLKRLPWILKYSWFDSDSSANSQVISQPNCWDFFSAECLLGFSVSHHWTSWNNHCSTTNDSFHPSLPNQQLSIIDVSREVMSYQSMNLPNRSRLVSGRWVILIWATWGFTCLYGASAL